MTIYPIKITTEKDSTLHICDDTTLEQIRGIAVKALKSGHEVRWFNGITQWIEKSPIMNFGREGSSYIWDKSGNKVKNEILLYSKIGDKIECEQIGTCFRNYI